MIPLRHLAFQQGLAGSADVPHRVFAAGPVGRQGETVMAAPLWAEGYSPIRYPSPAGHCANPLGSMPRFFTRARCLSRDCDPGLCSTNWIFSARSLAMNPSQKGHDNTYRGKAKCRISSRQWWRLALLLRSVDVATRSPSKPLSGQAPVLPPLPSRRTILRSERSLALRPMWPTASNTHRAADPVAQAPLGANLKQSHLRACPEGGFLRFAAAPRRTRKGTVYV